MTGVVGHLDTDRRAAGDRRQDADVGGGHRVGDVLLKVGDAGDLHAGAELELVAGDGGPDGHPDERGVDAVLLERIVQHVTASFDLAVVHRLLAGPGEDRRRGELPRAGAGGGGVAGRGGAIRTAPLRRRRGPLRVVLGGEVVQRRRGQWARFARNRPRHLRRAVVTITGERGQVAHRALGGAAEGPSDFADSLRRLLGEGLQRRGRDEEPAADAQREEDHDGAGRGHQGPQRLGDQRADPAARFAEVIESGGDLAGAEQDVERAERRRSDHDPSDGEAERFGGLSLPNEGDTDGTDGEGNDEPANPGEPADERLDAAPDGSGEVDEDRQRQQHGEGDEAEADELVLAPVDGVTQLGACPRTRRGRGLGWWTGPHLARGTTAGGGTPRDPRRLRSRAGPGRAGFTRCVTARTAPLGVASPGGHPSPYGTKRVS
jgi:hypothetical protein